MGLESFGPYENAMCADSQGKIWIGAKDGVISFNPLFETLSIHPRISIDKVSVFLEGIDFRKVHSFPHNRNGLAFDFSGIWLTDPETVKFRYKLEGFNQDWIVTSDRRVVFSSLPPGDFRFIISASENGRFAAEPVATYKFTIRTPYWKKPWFITAAIIAGFLLVYYIVKKREQRLKKEASLKREMVESQYETLKSQINPHFLFNTLNNLYALTLKKSDKAPDIVLKLSEIMRYMLYECNERRVLLSKEIQYIHNYLDLERLRQPKEADIRFTTQGHISEQMVAPLLFVPFLENSFKHGLNHHVQGGGFVRLRLSVSGEDMEFFIENSKVERIPRQNHPRSGGIGLTNVRQRLELLYPENHTLTVQDEPHRYAVTLHLRMT